MATGIDERKRGDGKTAYQAHVWDSRHGKRIRKTFDTKTAAKQWRTDAMAALRARTLAEAKPKTTVREKCEEWLEDARRGIVRTSGGDELKPGTLRRYEQALRLRVFPELGSARFYTVKRVHVQDFVDRMVADGVAPATIATTLGALGAAYGRSARRGEVQVSPTLGVSVPTARNGRKRFATREEAALLLAAVPEGDRGIWATAFYSGLRRGEIQALRWEDVDLRAGVLLVRQNWDPDVGLADTKNRSRRKVPILTLLREHLAAQRLRQPPDEELCFGAGGRPFRPNRLQERADKAWADAGLERLTPHDCRHTYASLAIAAGVNFKALSTYMGHSSVTITLDRYGHLMPGNESEAAGLMDDYLGAASG